MSNYKVGYFVGSRATRKPLLRNIQSYGDDEAVE